MLLAFITTDAVSLFTVFGWMSTVMSRANVSLIPHSHIVLCSLLSQQLPLVLGVKLQ